MTKKTSKSNRKEGSTKDDSPSPSEKTDDRVENFRDLTSRIAEGEVVVPPFLLRGHARREHVRATLREDHAKRIEHREPGASEKFDALSGSLFKFFRGTALLFYRDMVGQDSDMPSVMALGDIHPGNFGIMPDRDGVPIFGVNDFDETIYAPFTWDLKRGAVGFWIASMEAGGKNGKKRRKIVKKFLKGYLGAMQRYAERGTEKENNYRRDNSPKVLLRLFDEAEKKRKEWLWDDYLKENGRGFRADYELQPVTSEIEKFQKALESLIKGKNIDTPPRAGELKVKDVAKRHGQGTASLDLFYITCWSKARRRTRAMT